MNQLLSQLQLDKSRARLLLILACILCFGISIKNFYAMDDDFAMYSNRYVQQGLAGIPDILTHHYFDDGKLAFDYRPIPAITFAIEKQFFGNNPHVGHLMNVFFYILCVLVVFNCLIEVFSLLAPIAFVATLFFAIHPVHTEVVASIKNREEILSFLFIIWSFIYLHRYMLASTPLFKNLLIGLALMVLGLISKLSAVPTVGVMVMTFYMLGDKRFRRRFYIVTGIVIAISIVYFSFIAASAARPTYDLENPLSIPRGTSIRLGTFLETMLFYFRFLWFPYPFSFYYGYDTIPLVKIDQPQAVFSLLIHLPLFIYGLLLYLRRNMLGLLIMAYFLSLFVYSNLIINYTGIVSERAIFPTSLWFTTGLSIWVAGWYQRSTAAFFKQVVIVLAIVAILGYGMLDINRCQQWHSTMRVMKADMPHLTNSTLANYFYACVLKNESDKYANRDSVLYRRYVEEAKKYFYQVNTLSPEYPYGHFRLGLIHRYYYYNKDSAYYYFHKAYLANKDLTDVQYQWGRAEYEHGNVKSATELFSDLYDKIPFDTFTVYYHALTLIQNGQLEEGKDANKAMLKLAPNYGYSYFNEGLYYQKKGDLPNAMAQYETAIQYGYRENALFEYMRNYYQTIGRVADANRIKGLMR